MYTKTSQNSVAAEKCYIQGLAYTYFLLGDVLLLIMYQFYNFRNVSLESQPTY